MAARDNDGQAPGGRSVVRAVRSGRLSRLHKQHRELVAKVRHKRSAIARLTDEASAAAAEVASRTSALQAERQRCDRQLHQAFADILRKPGRSPGDRRCEKGLYRWLQQAGAISELSADEHAHKAPAKEAASAQAPSAAALRSTFLRLARAYHPDTAVDPALREDLTETMKDLNRAYEGGDISRLLELEGALDRGADLCGEIDATTLETQVSALRVQLRQLGRRMRELRGEYGGVLALEFRRLAQAGHPAPAETVIGELRRHTSQLRLLRDLVQRYCDRQIDLTTLLAGPTSSESDDNDWLEEIFDGARESLAIS